MNKLLRSTVIVTLLALPSLLNAQTAVNMELAGKYGCTACHKVDEKLIGPAYKDVYEKYKGNAGAEDLLVAKVKNGGAGVWGEMPMTPNPTVPDADLHAIVKSILGK